VSHERNEHLTLVEQSEWGWYAVLEK
jgi:hypothetical protein